MRKLLFALLLATVCVPLYTFTQVKRIKRRGPAEPPPVGTVIPVDQAALIKAVTNTFRDGPPPAGKFSRFSLAQAGEENFPSDHQLANHRDEVLMRRYLSIDPARRRLDFYLYDFSDADDPRGYWTSEYHRGGEPVPFRCNFIIHHEPDGDARHTRIEVFEFAPRVWLGKTFGLDRHGPGYRLDIRNVEPTTIDRAELLDLIREAAR